MPANEQSDIVTISYDDSQVHAGVRVLVVTRPADVVEFSYDIVEFLPRGVRVKRTWRTDA
jgi:hypothetical protein